MNQPTIKVINGSQEGWHSGVYCGRANMLLGLPQSPLANPYKIGVDGNRDQCCDKYLTWLRGKYKTCHIVRGELERIKDLALKTEEVRLLCYCAPKRCHCDSIKTAVEGMLRQSGMAVKKNGSNLPAYKIKATVTGVKGQASHGWHGIVIGIKRIRKDDHGNWIYYYQVDFFERATSSEKLLAKNPVIGMLKEQIEPFEWGKNEITYQRGKWIKTPN